MEENQQVRIVGRNALLNQLIAFAVRRELSCEVQIAEELVAEQPGDDSVVLLVDDADCRAKAALLQALARFRDEGKESSAGLFNVDQVRHGAHEAVRGGVRGIFFSTVQTGELLAGVRMLLNGQVSIPTQILLDLAMNRTRAEDLRAEQGDLTLREREILAHVSKGASNEEIASELFISAHTVKTHMYNIYRKIEVSNRLHATLWATENLRESRPAWAGL